VHRKNSQKAQAMVTNLQFVAIAIFLLWGLVSSLCDVFVHGQDDAHLVQRDRGPSEGR